MRAQNLVRNQVSNPSRFAVPSHGGDSIESPNAVTVILLGGQSLSEGVSGSPALTTSAVPNAWQLNLAKTALADLKEGLPDFSDVETQASQLITEMAAARGTGLWHCLRIGVAGADLDTLRAEPGALADAKTDMTQVRDLHVAAGRTVVFRAIYFVHGEADEVANNLTYASELETYRLALEAHAQSLGQTSSLPLFLTQTSAYPMTDGDTNMPLQQLAGVETYEQMFMVGPKYQWTYAVDNLHLVNTGYRDDGKVAGQTIGAYLFGTARGGFEPTLVSGGVDLGGGTSQVDITYDVPTPPIALDTTIVTARTDSGYEFIGDTLQRQYVTIDSVTLPSSQVVRLGLSAPVGLGWADTAPSIGYAYSGGTPPIGDPLDVNSAAGNVADSGSPKAWAVHHNAPITAGMDPRPAHAATRSFRFGETGDEQLTIPDGAELDSGAAAWWSLVLRINDTSVSNKYIFRRNNTNFISLRWLTTASGRLLLNVGGTPSVSWDGMTSIFDDGAFHSIIILYRGAEAVANDRIQMIFDGALRPPTSVGGTLPATLPDTNQPYYLGTTASGLDFNLCHFAVGDTVPAYGTMYADLWTSGLPRAAIEPSTGVTPGIFIRPDASDDVDTAGGVINHGSWGATYDATGSASMVPGDITTDVPT